MAATAWATSTRRSRLPADWAARRVVVLVRDHYLCQRCARPATDVDHIVEGDDHSYANLQSLCGRCHRAKTTAHATAAAAHARRARGLVRQRPLEAHPGLVDLTSLPTPASTHRHQGAA